MDRGVVMNRRDFLKKLGLGSVVAIAAPSTFLREDDDTFAWGGWASEEEFGSGRWRADSDTGWYVEANGDLQFTNTVQHGRYENV